MANGGIKTDPVDRTKLNIPDMAPNLTLLAEDGTLLDQIDLPDLHQNSIRHLALQGDTIAFALQWEGDPSEPVPQLGLWTPGQAAMLCAPPEAEALTVTDGAVWLAGWRTTLIFPPCPEQTPNGTTIWLA